MGVLSSRVRSSVSKALAQPKEAVSTVHEYEVASAGDGSCVLKVGDNSVEAVCEMAVKPGDKVAARWSDGAFRVQGNATHPATDDTLAEEVAGDVEELADDVSDLADGLSAEARRAKLAEKAAKDAADEAAGVANAIKQFFWHDGNGAHVSTEADTAEGTFNSLWNSAGLLLRAVSNNLVSLTRSALSFYDGDGNADANIVAQFGKSVARIGKLASSHIVADSDGVGVYGKSGSLSASFGEGVALYDKTGNAIAEISKYSNSVQSSGMISLGADKAAQLYGFNSGTNERAAGLLVGDMAYCDDATVFVSVKSTGGQSYIELTSSASSGQFNVTLRGSDVIKCPAVPAAHTVLAAPPNSSGAAVFRSLEPAHIPELFKVASFTSGTVSLNAGKAKNDVDISVTVPSGYVLAGVVGFSTNHNMAGTVGAIYRNGASKVRAAVTNRTEDTDWTDLKVTAHCLFVRSEVISVS